MLADRPATNLTLPKWTWRSKQINVLPAHRIKSAARARERLDAIQASSSSGPSIASSSVASSSTAFPTSSAPSSTAAAVQEEAAATLFGSQYGPRQDGWVYCNRCSCVLRGLGANRNHKQKSNNWCEGGDHQLPTFVRRSGDHAPTRNWTTPDARTHRAPPFPQRQGLFYRGRLVLAAAEAFYAHIVFRLATQTEIQQLSIEEASFQTFYERLPLLATVDPARPWRVRDLESHNRDWTLTYGPPV